MRGLRREANIDRRVKVLLYKRGEAGHCVRGCGEWLKKWVRWCRRNVGVLVWDVWTCATVRTRRCTSGQIKC